MYHRYSEMSDVLVGAPLTLADWSRKRSLRAVSTSLANPFFWHSNHIPLLVPSEVSRPCSLPRMLFRLPLIVCCELMELWDLRVRQGLLENDALEVSSLFVGMSDLTWTRGSRTALVTRRQNLCWWYHGEGLSDTHIMQFWWEHFCTSWLESRSSLCCFLRKIKSLISLEKGKNMEFWHTTVKICIVDDTWQGNFRAVDGFSFLFELITAPSYP